MKLNKEKHIGRVLFIVEGSQTEFSILRRIFCNILGYSYIESGEIAHRILQAHKTDFRRLQS